MLLSGISLDYIIEEQFKEKTQNNFSTYTKRTKNHLKNIESKLAISTNSFIKNETLLSKISFISRYENPEFYQQEIYDQEKKVLAKEIEIFSKVTQIDHIRLYNDKGILISFVDNQARDKKYGFLTYKNGKKEIVTFLNEKDPYYKISLDTPYWKKYLSISTEEIKNQIEYIEDIQGFNITYSLKLQTVFPDGSINNVGFIQAVKTIKHSIFDQIAIDNKGFNLLISESGKYLGPNPAHIRPEHLINSFSLFHSGNEENHPLFIKNNHLIMSHQVKINNGKNIFFVFGVSRDLFNHELNQIRLTIIFVFTFVTLLSISIAVIYFKKYTGRSFNKIINYADKIKYGNYNEAIPYVHEAELRHLTNVLKLTASTIQDREEELINAQSILEKRVEIRTKELKESKEEADKANLAKSQFLSSMSHELRTPLNAILGFAQLLEMLDTDKTHSENIREILQAGYHLLDLVNQILDLSKIEAGHLNLHIEPISITEILPECISQIEKSLAQTNNVRIINKVIDDSFVILVDKIRLRQVFINLLSNAVKYNSHNGLVTIEANIHLDKKIHLSITDTGVGISKHQLDKLFEPFERLEFKHGAIEGSGIGLTVTKQLVTAMNGDIGVDSIKGQGSTFWITLPQANGAYSVTKNQQVDNVLSGEDNSRSKHNMSSVLYIEDNPANLKLVSQIFNKRNDVLLLSASTAKEGLAIAENEIPDLILMDINLPDMSGFSALKTLKDISSTKNIPIIAVSANAMVNDIEQAKQSGFEEYITKPINVNEFLEVVENFLP